MSILLQKVFYCGIIYLYFVFEVKLLNIFISHSSADSEIALEAVRILEERGDKCFYAPRDITPGREYAEEIINGIDKSDVMLLIMTKSANESVHVLREVERAVSRNIPVVVYKHEDVELTKSMEYFLMTHQWLDSSKDLAEVLKGVSPDNTYYVNNRSKKSKKKASKTVVAVIMFGLFLIALGALILNLVLADEDKGNNDSQNVVTKIEDVEYELGDSIDFGTYNGEEIEWRIIKINEDMSAVLISEEILCMKAFDAAESGTFNYYENTDYWTTAVIEDETIGRMARGDNRWELSNLRVWLNSDKENVEYTDMPPTKAAMSERKNAYDTESGFLTGFTDSEISAILETEVITNGTITTDRVYLLSSQELEWLRVADVSIDAYPTDEAAENDASGWYEYYAEGFDVDDHYWWLRDSDNATAYSVMTVPNSLYDNEPKSEFAGLEGYGVRPVITVDLTSSCFD